MTALMVAVFSVGFNAMTVSAQNCRTRVATGAMVTVSSLMTLLTWLVAMMGCAVFLLFRLLWRVVY